VNVLIDQNLPASLGDFFRLKGWGATHVRDISLKEAADIRIEDVARQNNWIIVSKDADFRRAQGIRFLWVRLGNVRKTILVQRLQDEWSEIEKLFSNGGNLYELR